MVDYILGDLTVDRKYKTVLRKLWLYFDIKGNHFRNSLLNSLHLIHLIFFVKPWRPINESFNWVIIGLGNDPSLVQGQTFTKNNGDLLSINFGLHFSDIWIKIKNTFFQKNAFEKSSEIFRAFLQASTYQLSNGLIHRSRHFVRLLSVKKIRSTFLFCVLGSKIKACAVLEWTDCRSFRPMQPNINSVHISLIAYRSFSFKTPHARTHRYVIQLHAYICKYQSGGITQQSTCFSLHAFIHIKYRWLSARLQYLQCVSNVDTAILHLIIDISFSFQCTSD